MGIGEGEEEEEIEGEQLRAFMSADNKRVRSSDSPDWVLLIPLILDKRALSLISLILLSSLISLILLILLLILARS